MNIISEDNGKYSSVLNLTNDAITSIGKRYYREILLNPITNVNKLNKCYGITSYLLEDKKYQILRDNLIHIHDIEKFTRLIIMSKLPIRSLYTIVSDLYFISYKETYRTYV